MRKLHRHWDIFSKTKRTVFLLGLVLVCSVYLLVPAGYQFKNSNIHSKCVIPHTDPFDPRILKYIEPPLPLVLPYEPSLMYVDENGVVQYNSSVLQMLHFTITDITCSYSVIIHNTKDDGSTTLSPVNFTPPHRINHDFFKIVCTKRQTEQRGLLPMDVVYEHILTNIRDLDRDIGGESHEQLSVLMLGIDSVSRSAALRRLPKAMKYLQEELHAYDFKGYMKVGENTLPNLIPLLTGQKYDSNDLDPANSQPLLWSNFSSRQYATLYAEDYPHISTFNNLKGGFITTPTDHYQRPYWVELYKVAKNKDHLGKMLGKLTESLGIEYTMNMRQYFGKLTHTLGLEYFKQFIRHYKGKRKFGFTFFNELAHGHPSLLAYGDDGILDFFKWYKTADCKNCILIFFSDHGQRRTDVRHTVIGRIETRMPLLQIVIPDHIKSKHPEIHKSLLLNTERLSTPYDLHKTLVDVLNGKLDQSKNLYLKKSVRGISLFQPLPLDRSCQDAHIEEGFCACHQSIAVSTNSTLAKTIAVAMVTEINIILTDQHKCARLGLNIIKDVQRIEQGLKIEGSGIDLYSKNEETPQRYVVVIETYPGQGVFEAAYDSGTSSGLKMVGYIQRISTYGHQADCIKDKLLQNYCYCKSGAHIIKQSVNQL